MSKPKVGSPEWWSLMDMVVSSTSTPTPTTLKTTTPNSETGSIATQPVSESDPTGRDPHEPGAKLDHGKACAFRGSIGYFPRAIREVAAVSTFGASKYAWNGWQTVPEGFERYSDAMVRHLTYEGEGELTDPDSGLLHAAHTCWNALARLELLIREKNGS